MKPGSWAGGSRRLLLSFVFVLLVPAAAVVWLGVRLVDQDRALASRQLRERRESAADRFIASLEQVVASAERKLDGEPSSLSIRPDDDAVVLTLRPEGVDSHPSGRLLYVPFVAPEPSQSLSAFDAAEALEFRARDYPQAAAAYRAMAASPSQDLRAGALLRLSRALRKAGRSDEALRVYTELLRLAPARLDGLPADLVARRARCVLLEQLGRTSELQHEAQSLQRDLLRGRWPIDRATFETYVEQSRRWAKVDQTIPVAPLALSAAAEWVWRQWTGADRAQFDISGRRALRFGGLPIAIVWQRRGDRMVALLAGPRYQQREWLDQQQSIANGRGFDLALADADGQVVLGTSPADPSAAERRLPAGTGLPWTVVVGSSDATADLDAFATRRRLLLSGLAVLVGLVVTGGYFIVRAVSREFAVARLQSDFVSAVSHEFRTPLTSLHQFIDLLIDDPDLPRSKRLTFYQAQRRATDRLRRLVESLLDFGRMEAGARPYRLARQAIAPLVTRIVEEFRREATPDGFTIETLIADATVTAAVDTEAFSRALWNLLDNAVKYSGTSRTVSVQVQTGDGSIAVSVRDQGIGVPGHEHRAIFEKFVRGTATRVHGVKGTGIGLAMVKHIVDAHGGSVHVESAAGDGSTFTIRLPAAAAESDTSLWRAS